MGRFPAMALQLIYCVLASLDDVHLHLPLLSSFFFFFFFFSTLPANTVVSSLLPHSKWSKYFSYLILMIPFKITNNEGKKQNAEQKKKKKSMLKTNLQVIIIIPVVEHSDPYTNLLSPHNVSRMFHLNVHVTSRIILGKYLIN